MQPITRYSLKLLLQWRNDQYQPECQHYRIIVELLGGSLCRRSRHSLSIRRAGRSGAGCQGKRGRGPNFPLLFLPRGGFWGEDTVLRGVEIWVSGPPFQILADFP